MAPKNICVVIVDANTIPSVHNVNATADASKINVVSFMCF